MIATAGSLERRVPFTRSLLAMLALLLVLNLPLWINRADAIGWLVAYLTFAVLLCGAEFRARFSLFLSGVTVIAAHQTVALVNRYVGTVIGADMDAPLFHANAVLFAERDLFADPRLTTLFYTRALSFAYSVLGPSHLFGEELSVLFVAFSCLVFVRILTALGVERQQPLLLLLFGLLPTGLIFASVTMRESYQCFFMLLYALAVVQLRQKPSVARGLLVLVSVVGLGLLHNGLAAFGVVLLIGGLLWGGSEGRRLITWKRVASAIFAVIVAMTFFIMKPNASPAAAALREGKILDYAKEYREGTPAEGRANYGVMLDLSSPVRFLSTFALLELLFFVAPLPWQVQNFSDVYALLDAWLRVALLISGIVAWWRARGAPRDMLRFLLIVYLAIETLWSLGTTNWGTGIRHHFVAYGIVVLAGGPQFLRTIQNAFDALFGPGSTQRATEVRHGQ